MDIALTLINDCINLDFDAGDLLGDDGLETAVLISLFSDQRVTSADLPDGETSKRGWWGDVFPEVEGDQIGSKLWTFDRVKRTLAVLVQIETAATNALKWMLDDGVAKTVEIEAEFDDNRDNGIILRIDITRPDDTENRFNFVWDQQEIKRAV